MRLRRILHWLPVVLGLAFLMLLGSMRKDEWLAGRNDFVTFYAGAKLSGTPDLYSRAANLKLNESLVGRDMGMMYIRPPFYAPFLKPLSWMPFGTALAVFSLITAGCFLWFTAYFARECGALPFLASLSIPMLTTLCSGQDAALFLTVAGAFLILARRNLDFRAGLVLALAAVKFHLFLFFPLMFLLRRRWSMLGGGLTGVTGLLAAGAAANGLGSYAAWIEVVRNPWINPDASGMPNVHGLVAILGGGIGLEIGIGLLASAVFVWICLKASDLHLPVAASLLCGLLMSYHSTIVDDVLLFPVLIAILRGSGMVPLRGLAALALTPIPYFLVLAGPPYSGILAAVMLLLLAGIAGSLLAERRAMAPAALSELQPNPGAHG